MSRGVRRANVVKYDRRLEASKPQNAMFVGINVPVLGTTSCVWLATDHLYSDIWLQATSLRTQRKLLTKLFLMNDDNGGDTIVRSIRFLPQRLSYRYDAWWEVS